VKHDKVPESRFPLIQDNITFAKKLASQFVRERRKASHEADDYQSAALMGLCDAARRYEENKGVAFRTFAYFRIRGAMFDLMRRQIAYESQTDESEREIGFPSVVAKDSFEYEGLKHTIEQLRLTVHFNSEKHIGDISYASQLDPEGLVIHASNMKFIKRVVDKLPENEKKLVTLKYFEGKSFEKMRADFGGVSKSWLSRIHHKAIESLRQSVELENA